MADAGYALSAHGQDALPDHSQLEVRQQKKGGPPGWLVAVLIPVSMVGGAALAHRLTQQQVKAAVAAAIPGADSEAARRSSAGSTADPADPALSPATARGRDPRAPSRPGEGSSAPEARVTEPENPLDEDRNDGGGGTNQVVSGGSTRPARASAAARKSHHTVKSSDKTRNKH